jgi:hypothetical protein
MGPSIRPEGVNPLGVVLVIAGCVIALAALASLAVVALITLKPWSRFAPRYHRGVQPAQRPAPPLATLGGAVLEAGIRLRRDLAGLGSGRPVSQHPQGGRHLHTLLHGR